MAIRAEDIIDHYQGQHGRIACPAHQGTDRNCHVWNGEKGVAVCCFSQGCYPKDIMAAIERDMKIDHINPPGLEFQARYPSGQEVWRINRPDGTKEYPTRGPRDGQVALYWADRSLPYFVIPEGEKAAQAAQQAGFNAASYMGGASCAGKADYSAIVGFSLYFIPDNDEPGRQAAQEGAAKALQDGASYVYFTDPVNLATGADIADVDAPFRPVTIDVLLNSARPYSPATPLNRIPLEDYMSHLAPPTLVPGICYKGNLSVLFGPPKSLKSRLIFALLVALSPGGPPFCGQLLPTTPSLLITEEPPWSIGDKAREFGIPSPSGHFANGNRLAPMKPSELADMVYTEARAMNAGLVIIDTLGGHVRMENINDFSETSLAFGSLRQLSAALPDTAILIVHQRNKSGGDGEWGGALGSTGLVASADQVIRLERQNGQSWITVGGRNPSYPFNFDERTAIDIDPAGVVMFGAGVVSGKTEANILSIIDHITPVSRADVFAQVTNQMGDDAPSKRTFNMIFADLVKHGSLIEISPQKGNIPGTYKKPETDQEPC